MTAATFTMPTPRLFSVDDPSPVAAVSVIAVGGGVGATSVAAALRDGVPSGVPVLDVGACETCRTSAVGSAVIVTRPELIARALEVAHAAPVPVLAVLVSQITPRRLSRAERLSLRSSGAVLLPYADGGRPHDSTAWRRVVASLADHLAG